VRALAVVVALLALVACSDDSPSAAPSTSAPATTTTTAPAEAVDVLVLGDSVTAEVAQPIEAAFGERTAFLLQPHLPRTPGEQAVLRRQLAERDPEIIVFQVGHWERLKLLGDFATERFLEPGTYRPELVDPTLALLQESGAHVVWLSPIPIEDAEESAFVEQLAADFRASVEASGDAEWLDVRPVIAPDGFTEVLDGVQVRRSDGIHLCSGGQVLVAGAVLTRLDELDPTLMPARDWDTTEDACGPYDPAAASGGDQH
jgi:hypothetical protein